MQGPRITDSEFSSLPTPLFDTPDTMPDLPNSGSNRKNQIAGLGNQAKSFTYAQQEKLMPTPNTMDHLPARTPEQKALNKGKGGYANVRETVVNDLLRSPTASQGEGGALGEEEARKRGNTVGVRDNAMDIARLNGLKVSRAVDNLIPSPTSRDYKDGQSAHERDGIVQTDTVSRAIFNSGEVLLPTTRTSMANGPTQKEIALGNPKTRIETEVMLGETSWGKFEPAIRRWEQTLGRLSPLPTKPDGKDGAHRLSSAFTEWMMGLPTGWVTGVGLTRNEELKACGNGVVPQQAELALRSLLQGVTLLTGRGQVNLPTPTVSDIYTANLKSSQQKQGSMHTVTLPQAISMVSNRIEAGPELFTPTLQTDNETIGGISLPAEDRQ